MTVEQKLNCIEIVIIILSFIIAGQFYRICKLEAELEMFHKLVGDLVNSLRAIMNNAKEIELEPEVLQNESK